MALNSGGRGNASTAHHEKAVSPFASSGGGDGFAAREEKGCFCGGASSSELLLGVSGGAASSTPGIPLPPSTLRTSTASSGEEVWPLPETWRGDCADLARVAPARKWLP